MQDLFLWRLLDEDAADASRLAELLGELAKLDLRARFPFFGRLAVALEHAEPRVRAAALGVLAGAGGLPAWRWLVRGLYDAEPSVRLAAVEALRESAGGDSPRWAHALFHHDAEIRRTALAGKPVNNAQWYALYLRADPANSDLAEQALRSVALPTQALPTVVDLVARGSLARSEARRLIGQLPARRLDEWFRGAQVRGDEQVAQLLAVAVRSVDGSTVAALANDDPLDLVLDLFWDTEANAEVDAATGWRPAATFFAELTQSALRSSPAERWRVAAALIVVSSRRGHWNQHAADLCGLLWPLFFTLSWAERDMRYAAIKALYLAADRCPRYGDAEFVRGLLVGDLCRRASGGLDLWAIGGLLHLVETADPYQTLIDWFDLDRIMSSFLEAPEHSAPLFSVREGNSAGRRKLIDELLKRRAPQKHFFLALLVHSVTAAGFDFLDPLDAKQAVQVSSALLDLAERREMRLSPNKTRVAGGILARKLMIRSATEGVPNSAAAGSASAAASSAVNDFLKHWLTKESPERLKLGLEMLGIMSREMPGETLLNVARGLPVAELARFLKCVTWCPGFPYGQEVLLATDLVRRNATEGVPYSAEATEGVPYSAEATEGVPYSVEIEAWARSRLAGLVSGAPLPERRPGGPEVLTLSPEQAAYLAIFGERHLERALEPALTRPTRGLCAALARRKSPAAPSVPICAALLASHDPVEQVDEQFLRFGSDDSRFLSALDSFVLKTWEKEPHLPLLGRAWLHRWERHALALAAAWRDSPAAVLAVLEVAARLKSPLLGRQIWEAVARVVALWQYRDRARLATSIDGAIINALVVALPTPCGDLAAGILMRLRKTGVEAEQIESHRPHVAEMLVDLLPPVRQLLAEWIDDRGLGESPAASRSQRTPFDPQLKARVSTSTNLEELVAWCGDANVSLAEEAALRLIELGSDGVMQLAKVLGRAESVPAAVGIAATVGLWPSEQSSRHTPCAVSGDRESATAAPGVSISSISADGTRSVPATLTNPALALIVEPARDPATAPELRFRLALGLLEHGEAEFADDALDAVRCDSPAGWFRPEDWRRLIDLGVPEDNLARGLVASPHPHAYHRAVRHFLDATTELDEVTPLAEFLNCGTERSAELRSEAAFRLLRLGDYTGFPLLLQAAAAASGSGELNMDLLAGASEELVGQTVEAILAAGGGWVSEDILPVLLNADHVSPWARQQAFEQILADATSTPVRTQVVTELKRTRERFGKLRRVAKTFAWGVHLGRELTGRLFSVEMIGGNDLGYTRLEQNSIFINPLPILRREQHGEEIVEALILHELGHHMYHRGPEPQEIWKSSHTEGLQRLLNLVADEHLERNLRAHDRDFGDKLKRLGAYAFQHSAKEIHVDKLLESLQGSAFAVLSASRLGAARASGCVSVENGQILSEMEKAGLSFARFFRALRMGLGNRHADPKVEAGLALFKGNFRKNQMPALLDIARKLREIFGLETLLLESFCQEVVLGADGGEITIHGEGLTNEDLQNEIRRITDPRELDRARSEKGGGARTINVCPGEEFSLINHVSPVPFDRAEHARYAQQVARHARRLRRYLEELGITLQSQRRRISGRRIDRSRLLDLVLRGDPRMLVARRPVLQPDLFLGVIVDCSGSMQYNENIEKAKLFGVLLAEAAKGFGGIDLRLFGFTDQVIYDAGDADRPAVHALAAGGGNNDAAALWHAAKAALASRRKAKLLVMISDGLPTECTVAALRALVSRLSNRMNICCAQVAVQPLEEVCFANYILLNDAELDQSVRRFGETIARLVRRALRNG